MPGRQPGILWGWAEGIFALVPIFSRQPAALHGLTPKIPMSSVARRLRHEERRHDQGNQTARSNWENLMIPDPTFSGSQNLRAQSTFDESKAGEQPSTLRLDSCPELEWIIVKTQSSIYDIVVLSGASGEVAVRGGAFFPVFRRASFIGSLSRGVATHMGAVVVGLNLEFLDGEQSIVTSPVQSFSRCHLSVVEGRA